MLGGPRLSPGHFIARTPAELQTMAAEMAQQRHVGLDFETNGLRFGNGDHPIGYSMGYIGDHGPRCWYVPVAHLTAELQADPALARRAFKDALAGTSAITGHNLKFDLNMGRMHGYEIPAEAELHDSFIQSYLIYERRSHQLEARCEDIVGQCQWSDAWEMKNAVDGYIRQCAKERRMRFKKDDKEAGEAAYMSVYGHSEVPIALEGEYSCRDTIHSLYLDAHQRDEAMGIGEVWEEQRRYLYWNEMVLVRALADMEFHGQPVDAQYLHWLAEDCDKRLDVMSRDLSQQFGAVIDWGNDNELRDFLYNHLKLPVVKLTEKSKQPSVDRAAFLMLREHHAGMEALSEHHVWLKVRQTYTKGFAWYVDKDGRARCGFRQTGTKSGRLSAEKPNLQNVPTRHKAAAKAIRRAFYVEDNTARLYADYSQVELRVLGHVTGCVNLVAAYLSPSFDAYMAGRIDYREYVRLRTLEPSRDVHGEQAIATFGIYPGHEDWKVKRRAAKVINFGVPYGMGPPGLMSNPELMIGEAEAKGYFRAYHLANPEIAATKAQLFQKMLRATGAPYFVNWAGRAVHEPLLRSGYKDARSEGERSAFASLIQGSAGELTRFSLVVLYLAQRAGLPCRSTSTVHDEIQLDCAISDLPHVGREARRIMEDFNVFGRLPVVCDLEQTQTNWSEKAGYPLAA